MLSWCVMQVYVVTGGKTALQDSILSSTEVLTRGTSAWQRTGHLPSPRRNLRGVSIGGNFLVTGGQWYGEVIVILCNSALCRRIWRQQLLVWGAALWRLHRRLGQDRRPPDSERLAWCICCWLGWYISILWLINYTHRCCTFGKNWQLHFLDRINFRGT